VTASLEWNNVKSPTILLTKGKRMSELLDFMAKACHYAQEHCGDPDAWGEDGGRVGLLQCTSYQMACFLSQNTVKGSHGVGWDVIIEELTDKALDKNDLLCKSVGEWKTILQDIADELGGWK
jgi:hypothetical protein